MTPQFHPFSCNIQYDTLWGELLHWRDLNKCLPPPYMAPTRNQSVPTEVQPGEPVSLLGLLIEQGYGLLIGVWMIPKQPYHYKVSF